MKRERLLIIGLDGATFRLLDPLMDRGLLPTLAKIRSEGVVGPLRSTVPPVTVPAWSSFITGKNPGKHGISEFMIREKGTYEETPINARMRAGAPFWRLLGDEEPVLVLNVPTTYPPDPLAGVMISGFLTPAGKRDYVQPPELLDEIEARFGPYYLYFRSPEAAGWRSREAAEGLIHECDEMVDYKFQVVRYLIEKLDPSLVMNHVWGTDRLQHEFMHILEPDPDHPMHDPVMAAKVMEVR